MAGHGWALMASALVATIFLGADAPPTRQTPLSSGTGVITGRVIDSTTRRPVRDASVHVNSVPQDPMTFPIQDCCGVVDGVNMGGAVGRRVTTDADGRFAFTNLAASMLELQADKADWVSGWWGQTAPGDAARWIELRDGQRVDGVEIALARMPVVGGRVLDESGRPAAGVGVLVTPAALAGEARYATVYARTDDRGSYRSTVYPGEYLVSTTNYPAVVSAPGPLEAARPDSAFPRVFFPQANSVEGAARLILRPGDERTDIDFIVRPSRVYRISGISDGSETFGVELFGAEGRRPGSTPLAVARSSEGQFGFASVPPGRYILHAVLLPAMPVSGHYVVPLGQLPAGPTLWAEQEIAVADRDVNVRLALQAGVRISGRVEFDGTGAPPALTVLNGRALVVERADGVAADFRGVILPGGRFSTIQIEPGRYLVRPGPPEDWRLKSVMVGGRDVSDYPIELGSSDAADAVITFTDRRSAIAGRLIREGPDDLVRGWITVFPTDRAYWPEYGLHPRRMVFIECGRSGRFEAEVPPGSYYVAANRSAPRRGLSVQQLSTLAASATPVVVGDSQTVHVDVRFAGGR